MDNPHTHLESRVVKLETVVDVHAKELTQLRETSESLTTSIKSIEKTLQAIKNLAIGGFLVLIAQETGLMALLKTIILK